MAQVIGRIALSHGPQLLRPAERWLELPQGREALPPENPGLAKHLDRETQKAYYERCLGAMSALASKIDAWKPDSTAAAGKSGAAMVDYVPYYGTSRGIGCPMGFTVWE